MNQKTMPVGSNNDWLRYYREATSPVDEQEPSNHERAPAAAKPIRRRSRASKRTPTTLLNANANNFRALVQQFTGCPAADPLSLANRKGPVNLNFGLKNATPILEDHRDYRHHYSSQPPPPEQRSNDYYHNNIVGQDLQRYSSMYSSSSFNNTTSRIITGSDIHAFHNNFNSISSASLSTTAAMDSSDGFVIMGDHDLSIDDFSPLDYFMAN